MAEETVQTSPSAQPKSSPKVEPSPIVSNDADVEMKDAPTLGSDGKLDKNPSRHFCVLLTTTEDQAPSANTDESLPSHSAKPDASPVQSKNHFISPLIARLTCRSSL